MSAKLRQYGPRMLLAAGSCCAALAAAEIGLRVVGWAYTPLDVRSRDGTEDWRRYHAFEDREFVYDPVLLWRPRGKTAMFNSQGFRGRILLDPKPPNEFRLFALGDSNTLGWRSSAGSHWPGFLYKLLEAEDDRFEVTNAGVYGYTSSQGLQRLREILPYRPDMVLICFGGNDAQKVVVPDAEFQASAWEPLLLKSAIGHLVIAARDRVVASRNSLPESHPVPRVSLLEYRANLETMIAICRQNRIQCVLVTRPFIGKPLEPMDWRNEAPAYVAATLEAGRQQKVPVIDLHALFQNREGCFADNSHFTEAGHMLAAAIILEAIRPMLPR